MTQPTRRDPFRERSNASDAAEALEDALARIRRRYGVHFEISPEPESSLRAVDADGWAAAYVDLDFTPGEDEPVGASSVGVLVDERLDEIVRRITALEAFTGVTDFDAHTTSTSLHRRIEELWENND
jgi:hypothetical protein